MRSLALALLAVSACDEPQPALDVDVRGCAGIHLEVRDAALLPGWEVEAIAAERVQGDSGWALVRDRSAHWTLKAWPTGPEHPLVGLDAADEPRLLPGLREAETWLAIDGPAQVRVWRLGEAAQGELDEVPGLGKWPGPGPWTRRLLFIGDTPHLLAAPRVTADEMPVLKLAPIDPRTLTLGATAAIEVGAFCHDPRSDLDACAAQRPPIAFEILDVTAAGSMAGGAALLGVRQATPPPAPNQTLLEYLALELHRGPDDGPPDVRRHWDLHVLAHGSARLSGQIATDAASLFTLTDPLELASEPGLLELSVAALRGRVRRLRAAEFPARDGPLLQLGGRAVLGDFEAGRWSIAPLRSRDIDATVSGSLALDEDARISSAGREQLLVRPATGAAWRVVAICDPA